MASLPKTLPRFRPPLQDDLADADVLEELQALHAKDFSYQGGHILGSMCTAPHPLAVQAHMLFLETNLGDPGNFPGAREIETRYLHALLELAGAPPGTGGGQVTSGGSEANIIALGLMREITGKNEVVAPTTLHFSLEKAAKFMRMELKFAEVDDRYRVRPEAVAELVGPQTAGIMGIAGSTEVGSLDPLRALGEIAQDHQVPFHVDAAFGGYVLPFLDPPRAFGFDLPGVSSVTMDSHKMGMSTVGVGALLVRDADQLEPIAVETPYLSVARQRGVLGTRSGAPVAAAWGLLKGLGHDGYRRVVDRCLRTGGHLVGRLHEAGLAPLVPPELNILAVPVPEPSKVQADLTKLGWRVNVLPRLQALRLITMPHVTNDIVDAFVPDLARVVEARKGDRNAPTVVAATR